MSKLVGEKPEDYFSLFATSEDRGEQNSKVDFDNVKKNPQGQTFFVIRCMLKSSIYLQIGLSLIYIIVSLFTSLDKSGTSC